MENVGSILGREKPTLINRPSDEWVLQDTTLGLEVEVERVTLAAAMQRIMPINLQKYWAWHEDQSLHDMGLEFTFKNPLYGEDAAIALKGLLALCKENRWRSSMRTGIHVHMDARDLSASQLLGLIAYYTIFEPAIYAWVGDDRASNNFCLPWFKSEGSFVDATIILTYMKDYIEGNNDLKGQVFSLCENFHRYAGLNLKSLADYGSLEFRHLKTTSDYPRVKTWINILLSLKKAAMDVPESTMTIINGINRRGIPATLSHIFGEEVAQVMVANDPQVFEKIRHLSLPNAVEFVGTVTKASGEASISLKWNTANGQKEQAKNHSGFSLWRKENFPKGVRLTGEDKILKPLKKKSVPFNPFIPRIERVYDHYIVDDPAPPPARPAQQGPLDVEEMLLMEEELRARRQLRDAAAINQFIDNRQERVQVQVNQVPQYVHAPALVANGWAIGNGVDAQGNPLVMQPAPMPPLPAAQPRIDVILDDLINNDDYGQHDADANDNF